MEEYEKINFMKTLVQTGNIAAGGTKPIDLTSIKKNFGINYNSLAITNTDTDATKSIQILLNDVDVMHITANNGIWNFDWEDGLVFSQLSIKNNSAAILDSANLKISVGRTGVKK